MEDVMIVALEDVALAGCWAHIPRRTELIVT
jgi:hypothetical protein